MKATFKQFKSIEEIKSKGEFIKKGKIYPARIVKSSIRKHQHTITSRSNQWAFPTKKGYLIFVENNDGEFESVAAVNLTRQQRLINQSLRFSAKKIKKLHARTRIDYQCSPYSKASHTRWEGNHGLSDRSFLENFNRLYLNMNGDKHE